MILMQHQCIINALLVHQRCIISASSVHHLCIITASSAHHQCIIRASPAHYQCIISTSSVQLGCNVRGFNEDAMRMQRGCKEDAMRMQRGCNVYQNQDKNYHADLSIKKLLWFSLKLPFIWVLLLLLFPGIHKLVYVASSQFEQILPPSVKGNSQQPRTSDS